jgi:hypothetical protein
MRESEFNDHLRSLFGKVYTKFAFMEMLLYKGIEEGGNGYIIISQITKNTSRLRQEGNNLSPRSLHRRLPDLELFTA